MVGIGVFVRCTKIFRFATGEQAPRRLSLKCEPQAGGRPLSTPKSKKHSLFASAFFGADYELAMNKTIDNRFFKRSPTNASEQSRAGAGDRSRHGSGQSNEPIAAGYWRIRRPLSSPKKQKSIAFAMLFFWSGLRGSNPPPPPWQGGALPNELNPRIFSFGDSDGARFAARTARLGRRRL